MNLTETLSPFVSLGYMFQLSDLKLLNLEKWREVDSFNIFSYFSVALRGNSSHSYLKKYYSYYPDFFLPNLYFWCNHNEYETTIKREVTVFAKWQQRDHFGFKWLFCARELGQDKTLFSRIELSNRC